MLRAEIKLERRPAARTLVVLGYRDVTQAADAVPTVVEHHPEAVEGTDDRLIELEHSRGLARRAAEELPEGHGWLMAQFSGDSKDEATRKARAAFDQLHGAPGTRRAQG